MSTERRPRDAYLTMEEVGRQPRFFPLSKPITRIGRAIDNDIVLDDPRVSRLHAEVKRNGHRFEVDDAQSRNGTFVNGMGVPASQARVLVTGDRLSIGGFHLTFHDPASTVVADSNPGIVLEDRTGEVRVGGQLLALTPKEYVLLRMLLAQPGAVCGREDIARLVWPEYGGQVADYNIDNLVARLRQKIEREARSTARIISVKKRGYRLIAEETR